MRSRSGQARCRACPDSPSGFDWSRINAAIAAIPRGRWTTYGDLAQLGGTAAMPVGQHIASTPGLDNGYRVLGSDGKPRPDFHWDNPDDTRDVIERAHRRRRPLPCQRRCRPVAADHRRRAFLTDRRPRRRRHRMAIDSPPAGLVGQQEWDWDRYAVELGLPDERLDVGRQLVSLLSEAIAERNLPWKAVFRKGYVAFQRRGGYNTLLVDVSWRKAPRFAIKLPGKPGSSLARQPLPGPGGDLVRGRAGVGLDTRSARCHPRPAPCRRDRRALPPISRPGHRWRGSRAGARAA